MTNGQRREEGRKGMGFEIAKRNRDSKENMRYNVDI
jgi:hypothetical protein